HQVQNALAVEKAFGAQERRSQEVERPLHSGRFANRSADRRRLLAEDRCPRDGAQISRGGEDHGSPSGPLRRSRRREPHDARRGHQRSPLPRSRRLHLPRPEGKSYGPAPSPRRENAANRSPINGPCRGGRPRPPRGPAVSGRVQLSENSEAVAQSAISLIVQQRPSPVPKTPTRFARSGGVHPYSYSF